MKADSLLAELEKVISPELAKDLITEFMAIRYDCKTGTLGRGSVGKFVETVIQVLQAMETGKWDKKPDVDTYLRNLESRSSTLDDHLKIVCNRIARAIYALRNKRNIAHKGNINPNIYDLKYIYASAQWILTELVRQVIKTDINKAGAIIEFIQIPISTVVEEFGDRKTVFGSLSVEDELLILLHSYYPEYVTRISIRTSLDRRANSSISTGLTRLWKGKFVDKRDSTYKLTQPGFNRAEQILKTIEP